MEALHCESVMVAYGEAGVDRGMVDGCVLL